MRQHDSRRKALTLTLGIAVAAVAVAAFAVLQSGRGELRVDRLDDLRAVEDDDRVAPDLVVPELDLATRQSAISDDAPVTASAAPDGPITSARGVIVSARTFPEDAVEQVYAWPMFEEDPPTRGAGSAFLANGVEGTCLDGEWAVEGLCAGPWCFIVHARSGERRAFGVSKTVRLADGVENGPFAIVLDEYFLEGRVSDSSGRPIPGLSIRWEQRTIETSPVGHLAKRRRIVARPIQRVVIHQPQESADVSGSEWVSPNDKITAIWQSRLLGVPAPGITRVFSAIGGVIKTDPLGTYRIPFEGPGRIDLQVPDRIQVTEENTPLWIQQDSSVRLTADEPSAIRDFDLVRAATLVGRLTRADGGSVDGINVFARRESTVETMSNMTNEDGEFKLNDLEPGLYDVRARAGGAEGWDFTVYGQLQLNEGETVRIDEVLQPSSKIVGRVVDGDGRAVADVVVIATGALNPDILRRGTTDASGRFEIPGVYACTYDLVVQGWNVSPPIDVAVGSGPGAIPGGASDAGTVVVTPIVDDPGR